MWGGGGGPGTVCKPSMLSARPHKECVPCKHLLNKSEGGYYVLLVLSHSLASLIISCMFIVLLIRKLKV